MDLSLAGWESLGVVICINIITALGVYLTLLSGQMSIAHAAFAGVGAYVTGEIALHSGMPWIVDIVASGAAAMLFGGAVGAVTTRMNGLVLGLATLGIAEASAALAENINAIGAAQGLVGFAVSAPLWLYPLAALAIVGMIFALERTRWGLAARAVRDRERTSRGIGVPVTTVKILAFAVGAAISGIGGAFGAIYTLQVAPADMGFNGGLNLLIFVLFGGSYRLAGAVLGTASLTAIPVIFNLTGDATYLLYGGAIVLVMVVRPEGLLRRRFSRERGRGRLVEGGLNQTIMDLVARSRTGMGLGDASSHGAPLQAMEEQR